MRFNKVVGINMSRNLLSVNYAKILTILLCCVFVSSTFIGCSSKTSENKEPVTLSSSKKETINISSVDGGSITLSSVGEKDRYFSSTIMNPNGESFLLKEESKEQLVKIYEAEQRRIDAEQREKEELAYLLAHPYQKSEEYIVSEINEEKGTYTITFNTGDSISHNSGKITFTSTDKCDGFTAYDKDGNEMPDVKITFEPAKESTKDNEQIQEEPVEPITYEKFTSFLEVKNNGIASNDVWKKVLEKSSSYPIYQTESGDMYFTEKSSSNEYSLQLFSKNGEVIENNVIGDIVNIQERMYIQEAPWIAFKSNNDVKNKVTFFNLETKKSFSKRLSGYLYELFLTKNGVVVSTYDSLDNELKNNQEDLKYSKVALNDLKYTYIDVYKKSVKKLLPPKVRMKVFTNPSSDTVIWANKFNIHIYKQNIVTDKEAALISDFFLIDEILPTNDSAYWITPSNMFSFVYGTPNIFLVKDLENETLVADCFFPGRINYGSYYGVFTDQKGLLTVITQNDGSYSFNTISSDNPTQFTKYTVAKSEDINSYADFCIETIGNTRYICTQAYVGSPFIGELYSYSSPNYYVRPAFFAEKRSDTLIEKNVPILKTNIRKYTLP